MGENRMGWIATQAESEMAVADAALRASHARLLGALERIQPPANESADHARDRPDCPWCEARAAIAAAKLLEPSA